MDEFRVRRLMEEVRVELQEARWPARDLLADRRASHGCARIETDGAVLGEVLLGEGRKGVGHGHTRTEADGEWGGRG